MQVKTGVAWVNRPTFKILDPLYSYGMAEDTNFRFGPQIDHSEYYPENEKLGQIDTHSWSRDLLLNFGIASISLK